MKVKLILERQLNPFTNKHRKIVEVDIPDTDNTEADEKTKEELSKMSFSMFTNLELYMHIDKAIAPDITTIDGVRV